MLNNAGFAIGGDFRDLTPERWHRVLDVDLVGRDPYGCPGQPKKTSASA